jgi:MerR family transcriptional regulator, thiopeptide resistance regulator
MSAYRIRQFAVLAGVTVKTLHHYDRLGLLRPARTSSEYRVYRESDLQRLAAISALKLVGVPLKQIGSVLNGESRPLEDVLQSQRQMLHTKRQLLERAIAAIDEAVRRRASGDAADAEILKTLIRAIEMQNDVDVLKAYFDDDAWVRWHSAHPDWPGEEWRVLLGDIEGALDQDPGAEHGRELAARWMALIKADMGEDPGARRAFTRAWHAWTVRPMTRPKLLGDYPMERMFWFIVEATSAYLDRLGQSPETARVPPRTTPARRELFHEAKSLLGTGPDSPAARQLIEKLDAIFDREFGGDMEVRAAVRTAWLRRPHWPGGVTRWVASSYDMDPETWTAVADFLDAARVSAGRD